MKRPQSKQPSPKPTLKARPKPKPPASKPRTAATKPAPKKTVKPSSRKPAAAVRKVPSPTPAAASASKPARIPKPVSQDAPKSKQSQLITLLGSAAGASMTQMTEMTGWQHHTVRGAISGVLRKRLGLNVQCKVEEGVRIYRITEAAAA